MLLRSRPSFNFMAWESMLLRSLRLSYEGLDPTVKASKPESRWNVADFPTPQTENAESLYNNRNHAARQIYHAARGCNFFNYAARVTVSRGAWSNLRSLIFNSVIFTPRVIAPRPRRSCPSFLHAARGQCYAARDQVREQSNSDQSFTPRVVGITPRVIMVKNLALCDLHYAARDGLRPQRSENQQFPAIFLFSCNTSNHAYE